VIVTIVLSGHHGDRDQPGRQPGQAGGPARRQVRQRAKHHAARGDRDDLERRLGGRLAADGQHYRVGERTGAADRRRLPAAFQ